MVMEPARPKEAERRRKSRFRISSEMRFRVMENDNIIAEGAGETVDIGSSGVSFLTTQRLNVGAFIELSISWPVLLEENIRMRLVAFGRVLRSNGYSTACTVDKYEFRTQARSPAAQGVVRRDAMLRRWVEDLRKDTLTKRGAMA
jgi:hypothetical protein